MSSQIHHRDNIFARAALRILVLLSFDSQDASQITAPSTQVSEWIVRSVQSPASSAEGHGIDCTILLLPRDPNEWASLIRRAKASIDQKAFLAAIDRESERCLNALLDSGVDDVLLLPCPGDEVVERVKRLVRREAALRGRKELLLKYTKEKFIGNARAFLDAIDEIPAISSAMSPVLITGETGVGKELCARAIHYLGARPQEPFVPVNCGGLHEQLFESQLFGHVKGAYTGAIGAHQGLVHEAKGGTLFLDEVNTLSPSAQVKLLRFIENKQYRLLGSGKNVDSCARIISATNVNLDSEVNEKRFREDLHYRINPLKVRLPPLRSRLEDIPLLAGHFLEKFSRDHDRGTMYLSGEALAKLRLWPWTGNVRELKNVIESAVVMCRANIIRVKDITLGKQTHDMAGTLPSFREAKTASMEAFERDYLTRILGEHGWNVSKAATLAGKDRRSFQRLMRRHHIS